MSDPVRKYEHLEVGERRVSDPLVVDIHDMLAFARAYDPQWFHTDPARAAGSVFGEAVASGVYTAALWRKLDHQINGDVDFICGVAWEDVRWPKAVRAGDRLHATSEIMEKRASRDASRGVVIFHYRLINQNGDEVFSCRSVNLVRRAEND